MKFTINQEKAINVRNREVLVSAAAGSGKTSVLVERIIRRITDEESPIDIDRMLIMTFTKAAAKEMKDRIRTAIERELDEHPEDKQLLRQSMLIHGAQITTIHGFCQGIIRDHYEEIGIDPNFRVADENECKLICMDVLDEMLEKQYDEGNENFLNVVEKFAGQKSDVKLSELILKIYKFSQANAKPEEFLDACVAPYSVADVNDFSNQQFVYDYVEMYKKRLNSHISECKKALEIIEEYEELNGYKDAFCSDLDAFMNASSKNTYDDFLAAISVIEYEKLGRVSAKNMDYDSKEAQAKVKAIRDGYKKDIDTNIKLAFAKGLLESYEDMRCCQDDIKVIVNLVKEFTRCFLEKKSEKGIIDFNDMEHMAIRILEGNPSIADEYREYYEEIYVDEYQDSNMTQEVLVNLIKRERDSGNVFMVGDVKQSIYRFRQARPDIFVGKYDSFTDEDSNKQRILLNDNFRSRREVLDAVNEVFQCIMKREVGNIEYDDNAKLNFGAAYYPEEEGLNNKAEVIIGIGDDVPRIEFEAGIIANKINEIISSGKKIYDSKSKQMRPAKYKDIVILLRSVNNWQDTIKTVLENAKIPVAVNGSQGYFTTTEVQTVLSLLSVIDNPYQDIPLAAVMCSPIGGFTNAEIAIVRNAYPEGLLFDALYQYCTGEDGNDENKAGKEGLELDTAVQHKCHELLDKIEYYRKKTVYTPVHGLIREIIDKDYGDYVRLMDRGEQRIANLNMLMVKAEEYGKTSFRGLFNFVRYMELIKKYEIEDGEATVLGDEDDVVRIMTIHKSKGLEFPICFLAGIDKRRNDTDEKNSVVWDAKYGIGIDRIDLDRRIKFTTLYKNVIKQQLVIENVAEEMRVLYVALTRACEKLYMIGWAKDDEVLTKSKGSILLCSSYLDMILLATGDTSENIMFSLVNSESLIRNRMEDELKRESSVDEVLSVARGAKVHAEYDFSEATAKLVYKYPFGNSDIPVKLSVSQLKHKAMDELVEDRGSTPNEKRVFTDKEPESYIPAFARSAGEKDNGGSFYGTAFHRILELWRYDIENVKDSDVERFVEEMLKSYRMSADQVAAIRFGDIREFLNSDLGKRMYSANLEGKLYREQPFVIGVKANELEETDAEDIVLVQGIIDAFIIENDEIVIIDYKTDSVKDGKRLVDLYKAQLRYYKKALSQITGKKVKELIIYSSRLREILSFE